MADFSLKIEKNFEILIETKVSEMSQPSVLAVLIGMTFVCGLASPKVVMYEAKGRLLCHGKDHGKKGLSGWPKIVQFWNMETDCRRLLPERFEKEKKANKTVLKS